MIRLKTWPAFACALLALLLSVSFAFTNPPFESPDEPEHLNYVQFVASRHTLPNQLDENARIGQGHHYPLYYVFASVVYSMFPGTAEDTNKLVPNPLCQANGGTEINVPLFIDSETKLKNSARFYVLRILSCLFGFVTVLLIGLCAYHLVGGKYWWIAPFFVATLPQFLFISGSITNDSLAATLAAATITFALWTGQDSNRSDSVKLWLICGVLLGLAILTKKSCLALFPPLVFYAAMKGSKKALAASALLAGTIAVCAFLFFRNYSLYGEFFGNQMERDTLSGLVHEKPFADRYFITEFPRALTRSFFGHFGWMNVPTPTPMILFGALSAGFMAFVGARAGSNFHRAELVCLLLVVVTVFLGVYYYNLTYTQPQGRLLFPMLPALALLIALGANKIAERWRQIPNALCAVWLAQAIYGLILNAQFYTRGS